MLLGIEEAPCVSIITVTFNAEKVIEETIDSIIRQDFTNYEMIVIDGGSRDNTLDILNKYRKFINFMVSEPDNGIYDAMNKGINHSRGKWLCFMNAGDVFYNDHVLTDVFSNHDYSEQAKLLYGDVSMVFDNNRECIKNSSTLKGRDVPINLCHQATFTDGDYLREHNYDVSYKIAADTNSFYNIYKAGYILQYVPVIISKYEASLGVSSKNVNLIFKEFMRVEGLTPKNNEWWRRWLKNKVRLLFMHCLPSKLYSEIMVRRLFKVQNNRQKQS